MLKASNDERGTVAALAKLSQDLDDIDADGMLTSFVLCYNKHLRKYN